MILIINSLNLNYQNTTILIHSQFLKIQLEAIQFPLIHSINTRLPNKIVEI